MKNKKILNSFLLGLIISAVWVIVGRNQYSYNYTFFEYKGFDWFPFLLWGIGLPLIYIFYLFVINKVKAEGLVKQFLIFIIIYWPILIIAETIGYNVLNLHDLATADYPPLPLCQCMHAPAWMKIVYFSLGPIYFFAHHYLLNLKNNSKDNVG